MLDAVPVAKHPEARGEALDARTARIELEGELPLGWLGNLASGLSKRGVSIVRGSAEREGTGWRSSFEVVTDDPETAHPKDLDHVALALEEAPEGASAVVLESFILNVPLRGAAVELTVRGRDRTGFLAALLGRLALLGLYPGRISVETVHGAAADTLYLQGLGGAAPTPGTVDALREFLRGVTRGAS